MDKSCWTCGHFLIGGGCWKDGQMGEEGWKNVSPNDYCDSWTEEGSEGTITGVIYEGTFTIGETVKHYDAAYSEEFTIVDVCSTNDENDFMIQGPKPKYSEPFAVMREKLIKV